MGYVRVIGLFIREIIQWYLLHARGCGKKRGRIAWKFHGLRAVRRCRFSAPAFSAFLYKLGGTSTLFLRWLHCLGYFGRHDDARMRDRRFAFLANAVVIPGPNVEVDS